MAKQVRPTVRFGEKQYEQIQARLNEKGVTFQQYCLELICNDLGVPVKEFTEPDVNQQSFFDGGFDEDPIS